LDWLTSVRGLLWKAQADVAKIRFGDFAHQFGFTADQIKAWEQGRARPIGGVGAYLLMIDTDHEAVTRIFEQARLAKAA
jgi:hypothetical protein